MSRKADGTASTNLAVEPWPFEPNAWETNERWWAECHLPDSADKLLAGDLHWAILIGSPGSGKSTALANMLRVQREKGSFIIEYPPSAWPELQKKEKDDHKDNEHPKHLAKIMEIASRGLRDQFSAQPDLLYELSDTQKEFIHWIVDQYNAPRAYTRWLDSLAKKYDELMRNVETRELQSLYSSENTIQNEQLQVEELVSLCRRIGFKDVLVVVDAGPVLNSHQMEQLRSFYTWLEPMHHGGFRCISAVTEAMCKQGNLIDRARWRVSPVTLSTTKERTNEIIACHLKAATKGQVTSLDVLANRKLLEQLGDVIEGEFGGPAPGAWICMARILIHEYALSGVPCSESQFASLRNRFYQEYMPLRIFPEEKHRGVWRGPNFIELEQGLFDFLMSLYRHKGQPVDFESLDVRKENAHTLASRTRSAIEPGEKEKKGKKGLAGKKEYVYILSERNEGYRLNNFF